MKGACERRGQSLSLYLDGEMGPSESSELRQHLDSCEACRSEIESFRELSDLLASRAESDPFFLARFRARRAQLLGGNGALQVWRKLAVRLLPLAAGALLGAVGVVWLSLKEPELGELEARQLGDGFLMGVEDNQQPVLQIAFEPFPGGER